MARIDPLKASSSTRFRVLLELVRLSHVWIKLTGADRITRAGPPYADVVPFARLLVESAPDRVIWGTDWPHSGVFDAHRMPDDLDLVALTFDFARARSQHRALLVDNAARLFGR
jgi:predicted TIM-barrel fold metal-dependent hydrolase